MEDGRGEASKALDMMELHRVEEVEVSGSETEKQWWPPKCPEWHRYWQELRQQSNGRAVLLFISRLVEEQGGGDLDVSIVAMAIYSLGRHWRSRDETLRNISESEVNVYVTCLENVILEKREELSPGEVTLALHGFAGIWANQNGKTRSWDLSEEERKIFCALLDVAAERIALMNCQEVATILWSAAKLGVEPQESFFQKVAMFVEEQAGNLKAQEFSNILWGWAKFTWIPPASASRKMEDALESIIEGASTQALANILWSWGKYPYTPQERSLQIIIAVVLKKMEQLTPQGMCNIFWGLSRVGGEAIDRRTYDLLVSHAVSHIGAYSPQGLSILILAWGQLGITPPKGEMRTFMQEVIEALPQFTPQGLVNLLKGLAAIEFSPGAEFCRAHGHQIVKRKNEFGGFAGIHILASWYKLEYKPSAAEMIAVERMMMRNIESASPRTALYFLGHWANIREGLLHVAPPCPRLIKALTQQFAYHEPQLLTATTLVDFLFEFSRFFPLYNRQVWDLLEVNIGGKAFGELDIEHIGKLCWTAVKSRRQNQTVVVHRGTKKIIAMIKSETAAAKSEVAAAFTLEDIKGVNYLMRSWSKIGYDPGEQVAHDMVEDTVQWDNLDMYSHEFIMNLLRSFAANDHTHPMRLKAHMMDSCLERTLHASNEKEHRVAIKDLKLSMKVLKGYVLDGDGVAIKKKGERAYKKDRVSGTFIAYRHSNDIDEDLIRAAKDGQRAALLLDYSIRSQVWMSGECVQSLLETMEQHGYVMDAREAARTLAYVSKFGIAIAKRDILLDVETNFWRDHEKCKKGELADASAAIKELSLRGPPA